MVQRQGDRIKQIFGNFSEDLVFDKIYYLIWQIWYAIGQIFMVVNCQILNK